MIQVYCDVCWKKLKKDCADQVNLDFNAFGITGFKHKELNLCVRCAELVLSKIEELGAKIEELGEEVRIAEAEEELKDELPI